MSTSATAGASGPSERPPNTAAALRSFWWPGRSCFESSGDKEVEISLWRLGWGGGGGWEKGTGAEEASCSYTWIPRNKYSQTYFFFLFLFFIGFPIIFLGLTTSSKIILQLSNLRFTLFIVKYLLVSASFITRQISC